MGEVFAEKANAATGPVAFLIPLEGVSILDGEGERFCDREADGAMFETLKENLRPDIPVGKHRLQHQRPGVRHQSRRNDGGADSKRQGRSLMFKPSGDCGPLEGVIDAGLPIIGAGAGTGISAKLEEAGGADLIVIYNSGRFRMAGRGSLAGLMPYGDANAIVMEMAGEVLTVVETRRCWPVSCGTDPFGAWTVFLGR